MKDVALIIIGFLIIGFISKSCNELTGTAMSNEVYAREKARLEQKANDDYCSEHFIEHSAMPIECERQ